MKIKSAKAFRTWYKIEKQHIKDIEGCDENYIGCMHQLDNGEYVKGFFNIYHGGKEDVGGFLNTYLKIAEDGQAIYEFLQNAADCKSSLFYMFYNDKYLLAVNNGNEFNIQGLCSILDIGQSTKSDTSQIGRFGIGFKLVHRLVGKGDGLEELIEQYKGPILFSWSKKRDLLALMNNESMVLDNNIEDSSGYPLLLKIILTNFPAAPFETVKDLSYQDRILFSKEELNEMTSFVNDKLRKYVDTDNFETGSLFFIKLGEGKKALLDNDYEQNFKKGVEYSLNTIHNLKNVIVNDKPIEKVSLMMEKSFIQQGTPEFDAVSPEYKDSDINFAIGYNQIDFDAEHPFLAVEELKASPTFYKYFPLSDEIHSSALFIHCDSISNESNRRKLHDDHINKNLFPLIAKYIKERLTYYKSKDDASYDQLYANILMTDSAHGNSEWLNPILFDQLHNYAKYSIPTEDGYCQQPDFVKIKRVKSNVPLDVIESIHYHWFKWSSKNMSELITEARDKLGLESWNILNIIKEADIDRLNHWIEASDDKTYKLFLDEIEEWLGKVNQDLKDEIKQKIGKINLFKFSDGKYHSYAESIINQGEIVYADKQSPLVFLTTKTQNIKGELITLGCIISEVNISNYYYISHYLKGPADTKLFEIIQEKVIGNTLTRDEKRNLLLNMTSENSALKFEGVGESSIKKLSICKNSKGEFVPLCEMVSSAITVSSWLKPFQINKDDFFVELTPYLLKEEEIYSSIILPKWDDIIKPQNPSTFYDEVKQYYDIDESGARNLSDKDFVFVGMGEFVYCHPSDVFYNERANAENVNYIDWRLALLDVFGKLTPEKIMLKYLGQEPFMVQNTDIEELAPSQNTHLAKENVISLLEYFKNTGKSFFKYFVIQEDENNLFSINERTDDLYQISTYNISKVVSSFIEKNCSNTMIALPSVFSEYRTDSEIVKEATLYAQILSQVEDVDENASVLVDIVKYDSRMEFAKRLSSIMFDMSFDGKDSWEYKIADLLCSILGDMKSAEVLNEVQRKIVIKNSDGIEHFWKDIPNVTSDEIELEKLKKPLSLSKILPNQYSNTHLVSELILKLSKLGINVEKLNNLFGVTSDLDTDNIMEILKTSYDYLENSQQLAFVYAMCEEIEERSKFKVRYFGGDGVYNFNKGWYTHQISFVDGICLNGYNDIDDYVEYPKDTEDLMQKPYINSQGIFICEGLKESLSEEEIVDFLNFLHKNYSGYELSKVSWIKIDDKDVSKVLGFNPTTAVYPPKYGIKDEQLSDVAIKWIAQDESHLETLKAIGTLAEDSELVKIRKYFVGENAEFSNEWLYDPTIDKDNLENTLKWLSEKDNWMANSKNEYANFESIINRINEIRNVAKIVISQKYDIEQLAESSSEYNNDSYTSWKEETGYSIYCYDGKMPQKIFIDEYITEHPIYQFNEGDVCDDGDKCIFVNSNADIQAQLHKLASDNSIGLKPEAVYKLFDESIAKLQEQIARLKTEKEDLERSQLKGVLGTETDNSLDIDERAEYSEEAKKKIREYLETKLDYKFSNATEEYSVFRNVINRNKENIIVVAKSFRNKSGQLMINPTEYGCVLQPKAELWVYLGGDDVRPLFLQQLVKSQDKLTLSIETSNLDYVERANTFANVLKWFKQVHFNFNNIRPLDYSVSDDYKRYAFDDRPMDEKPSVIPID